MNKIVVATPGLGAYSETFIRAHIERLPAEVHVLYGGHLPTLADDGMPLVKKYGTAQRVRFRLAQQLRGQPWDGRAKQTAAIERFLRQHRIQAVLAEYGPTGVAMMDACVKAEVPLVVHFHGYDAFRRDIVAEYQQAYKRLFDMSAALIASSNSMKERLISLGAPTSMIYTNPYGVDVDLFNATAPESNPPHMVAVGRFVAKKAPYLTVLAFQRALQSVPDLRLTMIGDGPLWEVCHRLASSLHIADKINFLGVRQPDEIATLMQGARGFVQHSLVSFDGDSESFGIVFIEAAASGLPVIATRHDGIPEVVSDGETGILVEEGDVDGMAQAMIRLAQEPELAAKMGRAGRRRVEEHFAMDKSIGNLWKIIQSAIDNQGQTHAAR